jgi:hemoglobin
VTGNMVDETQSDYQAIGGAEAVKHVVGRFYEMVLADPELAPYFVGVDLVRLKRHQVLLVSQVLGGPAEYDGRDLKTAHQGRGITKDHFGRVVVHLVAALREAGVPEEIIGRVGEALGPTEGDVVESESI